jgi:hypothetical protein
MIAPVLRPCLTALLLVTLVGCSSSRSTGDGSEGEAAESTTAAPSDGALSVVQDDTEIVVSMGQLEIRVDRASAVFLATIDGSQAAGPVLPAPLVLDDQELNVTAIGFADPGLDHVTIEVTYGQGVTGRVEVGGLPGSGALIVRSIADDPAIAEPEPVELTREGVRRG